MAVKLCSQILLWIWICKHNLKIYKAVKSPLICMDLICPFKLFKHVTVWEMANPNVVFYCHRFAVLHGNICADPILELAVFTVLLPASKSATLLDPHPSIWCTVPSASQKAQQSLFLVALPWLCTKTHSRLNWRVTETNGSHQSS